MAHQLKAEERKRLTCIADQWRRTENKDNQNRVLQCMTDYTKLFFNRMGKPGTDSCNGQHKSLNTNDEDKSEDKSRADAVQVPRNQRGASRQGQTHHFENQRSKPHAFNPGISIPNGKKHDDRNGNLQSILHIGDETVKLEELIRIFDNDVARSGVDMSHPTQFGLVPGSGHILYSASEYLASITHVLSIQRLVNAGAIDIELSVLRWVSDIIGYPEQARGTMVSGTSMGVIVAFSTARHVKLENSSQFSRSVVYMTDLAHFTHTRGLRVVGLADIIVRHVPAVKYRMDVRKLKQLIMEDQKAGLNPFMVIGSVGTTSLGTIDPLLAISGVAKKHGLWFHVDAAIGGCLMLDESVKKKCEGINMSDSVALDFHKSLSAPYGSAAVLIRDGRLLKWTMAKDSAPFFPDSADDKYSPIDVSFEATRPFRAFPVWFMLKSLGTQMIKTAMQEKVRLTKYALKSIRHMTNVVTCTEPDLTVIAFRYFPPGSGDRNDVTRKWHQLIAEEGQVCLTPTTEDGLFYIRLCILSFRSHIEDVDIALASIRRNLNIVLREKDIAITRL